MLLLPVILALAQTKALAPARTPVDLPPAWTSAAHSFAECLVRTAYAVPQKITGEVGAQLVVASCAPERAALDKQADTLINDTAVPPGNRQRVRDTYRQLMDDIPAQVTAILAKRGAAVPAPDVTATPRPR